MSSAGMSIYGLFEKSIVTLRIHDNARTVTKKLLTFPPPIQIVSFNPISSRIFISSSENGTEACLPPLESYIPVYSVTMYD